MANKDSMIGPNNIQGIDPTLLQLQTYSYTAHASLTYVNRRAGI